MLPPFHLELEPPLFPPKLASNDSLFSLWYSLVLTVLVYDVMMDSHLAKQQLERKFNVAGKFVYGKSVTWARCHSKAGWEEGRGHICVKSNISAALPHSSLDKGGKMEQWPKYSR